MEFMDFKTAFQSHIDELLSGESVLFTVNVDKTVLWDTYMNSFPPGTNEMFRVRREHDCANCRHFIKDMGSVVVIKDNRLMTIWDFDPGGEFSPVMRALSDMVKAAPVQDVFVTKLAIHGIARNNELKDGNITTWNHLHIKLPTVFVTASNKSIAELTAGYRDIKQVFKRSLEEIERNAIQDVLDLIAENALYRGEEWQAVLKKFLDLHDEYHALPEEMRDNFCWVKSVEVGAVVGKIRNHSIGVLLQDISGGMGVDEAVRRYESMVAPTNYKRPKALFTKRMVEDAQKTVEELGLANSLGRRYAGIGDVNVNNVIWANRDAQNHMAGKGGAFDLLKQEASVSPKKFENVEGIPVEKFLNDILPTAKSIEVLFENRHQSNLVSLIAPQVAGSPTLFKWGNPHSWAYGGNMADSMKQLVKAAGGKVDGVFRNTMLWNHQGAHNPNDYDLHVTEPDGNEIYYPSRGTRHRSSGMLDVDITFPSAGKPAVENTIYTRKEDMPEGDYIVRVHCFNYRGGRDGFDFEIEIDGQLHEFSCHQDIRQGEYVTVAKIHYSKKGGFEIISSLPSTTSSRTVWALSTNQFFPVSVFMYSPNYWDGQNGIGNKHYFFMLPGCKNDESPNGFYNEFLREEFMPHKHVFEALGAKMKVAPADEQLSGLGFSSTKRDSLIVKVDQKLFKIVF